MDGATRGKPGLIGIGGVLRNHEGITSIFFNESMGVRDSNEAEILSNRRALTIWKMHGQGKLILERDLANAIKWAKGKGILNLSLR